MIGQRIPDITFKTRVKDEEGNYDCKDVTTCTQCDKMFC